jgi:protein HOOK3
LLIAPSSQTTAALRQKLDEVLDERDRLLQEKAGMEVAQEVLEKELKVARTDR